MKIRWTNNGLSSFEYYIDWYREKDINVSLDFKDTILNKLKILEANPYIARKVEKIRTRRELIVQEYLFLIIYSVQEDINTLNITRFLHQSVKH